MAAPTPPQRPAEHTSVKETLISITIAFALAFVFRAFVIEAYVIPTGSMAPTLMGQHMRFQAAETGYQWPVNPWQMQDPAKQVYAKDQTGITVHDPMSSQEIRDATVPRRAGDRILVLKFLHHFFDPSRFDVVVFKCPYDPKTNFIKRLLGLPGEQVALIDGDIFSRVPKPTDPEGPQVDTWSLDGWTIDRKPERIQRAVWQPVFDSAWTPEHPEKDGRSWFVPPWTGGDDANWKIQGRRTYRHEGSGPARLDWQTFKAPPRAKFVLGDRWVIDDRYAYNEQYTPDGMIAMPAARHRFPVSDLRLSCGLEPEASGMTISAIIRARHHEFRAIVEGAKASVQMRPDGDAQAPWTTLASASLDAPLPAGRVTNIEFWHVDQALELWVDGRMAVSGVYDWTPAERVRNSMGISLEEALATSSEFGNIFAEVGRFQPPEPAWEFTGGPFTLHRVALDRDLHYRAAAYDMGLGKPHSRAGDPANATHPYSTPTLGPDQFFTCGDNSPASFDARLWDVPDPAVASEIDPTIGVVPRALMLGKAFFVYFPSTTEVFGSRVLPDFGRLRWIW